LGVRPLAFSKVHQKKRGLRRITNVRREKDSRPVWVRIRQNTAIQCGQKRKGQLFYFLKGNGGLEKRGQESSIGLMRPINEMYWKGVFPTGSGEGGGLRG